MSGDLGRSEKPAPRWDDFRVYLTSDGRLRNEGWRGFVEPTCPTCNKPIAWVLDMMSFKGDEDGGFTAHHAHCVTADQAGTIPSA